MILRAGMFVGVHDSLFGISSGQTREHTEVIITQAGWYNQLGQLLGEGDLALEDFVNILSNLPASGLGSLIVVPARDAPHNQLSPKLLAERCAFIIHPDVIHIIAPPSIITEYRFAQQRVLYTLQDGTQEEGPLPYTVSNRTEAHALFGEITLH